MIRLWVSAETDREVSRRLMSIAREVKRLFNSTEIDLQTSDAEFEIRYIPIVMANGGSGRYPSRTKCYPDEDILDLCPILDHESFRTGTSDDAAREFFRGLKLARPLLPEGYRPEFDLKVSSIEKELGVCD